MLHALLLVGVVSILAFGAASYESHPLPADAHADRVVVEKSARKLTLFRGETPLKTIAHQKVATSSTRTSLTAAFIGRCTFLIPVLQIPLRQLSAA